MTLSKKKDTNFNHPKGLKIKELEINFLDSARDLEYLEQVDDSKELLRFIAKKIVLLTQVLKNRL